MTTPRRLVPGQTHTVARRTSRRTKLLLPGDRTESPADDAPRNAPVNAIVLYALGRALIENSGVQLHAYTTTATHEHSSLTDEGDPARPSPVPRFFQQKNGLTARALNAHYGRGEAVWRAGSYDNVEVHDPAALEAQLLYVWTNNVKDGQVRTPEEWPGVKFLPEDFGRTIVVPRPKDAFFGGKRPAGQGPTDPDALDAWTDDLRREDQDALQAARDRDRARGKTTRRQRQLEEIRRRRRQRARERERLRPRRQRSTLPDFVTITIHPPPGYEHLSLEEVRAHFRRLLDAKLARTHAQRLAEGKTRYVGVAALLAEDPLEGAGDTFPRFKLNPRVACKDRDLRIAVLQGLVAWRAEVADKRVLWRWGAATWSSPSASSGCGASTAPGSPAPAPTRPAPPPCRPDDALRARQAGSAPAPRGRAPAASRAAPRTQCPTSARRRGAPLLAAGTAGRGLRPQPWDRYKPNIRVRRAVEGYLARKLARAPKRGKGARKRRFLDRFLATAKRWRPGLYVTYGKADPEVPHTSNFIEATNGISKRHLRRVGGRASTSGGPVESFGELLVPLVIEAKLKGVPTLQARALAVPRDDYLRSAPESNSPNFPNPLLGRAASSLRSTRARQDPRAPTRPRPCRAAQLAIPAGHGIKIRVVLLASTSAHPAQDRLRSSPPHPDRTRGPGATHPTRVQWRGPQAGQRRCPHPYTSPLRDKITS